MQQWWWSFVICYSVLIGVAVTLPPSSSGLDTTPAAPREFPKLTQNYTFVDNSSIRENLANHADVDTEVEDLLGVDETDEKGVSQPEEKKEEIVQTTSAIPTEEYDENVNKQEGVKQDETVQEEINHEKKNVGPGPSEQEEDIEQKVAVEWIENGENTEDKKISDGSSTTEINIPEITEIQITIQKMTSSNADEPYKDGVPVMDGTVAVILVGVFLVMCIFGYTALILWRRSLELKYGSREMLVDKDDFFDPDDMKHFSI